MRRLKRFGRDLLRTAWSNDWFHWYLFGVYVFFGVIGGMVWSELSREVHR